MRNFLYLSEQLGCRCLVKPGLFFQSQNSNGLQDSQCAKCIRICRVLRRFKRYRHMALGGQIVYFIRPDLLNDTYQIGRIGQVAIVKYKSPVRVMGVFVKMIHPIRVEQRCPSLDAMDDVAFFKQEFCQIGTVLACDACD